MRGGRDETRNHSNYFWACFANSDLWDDCLRRYSFSFEVVVDEILALLLARRYPQALRPEIQLSLPMYLAGNLARYEQVQPPGVPSSR